MAAPQIDEYSAFESINVEDFGDGRHLGVLEPTAPASGFRYSKDVWFTVPFSAFGGGPLGTGTAIITVKPEWTIQIRDAIDPTTRKAFEQTVILPVQIICQLVGGNVGFAFWSPVNEQISVETTIIEGANIPLGPYPGSTDPDDPQTHHQGWPYVDTSNPTPFSEQGLPDFNFADTGAFTAFGILVRITYYSAPYKVVIAPGAVFDAVRDTAGIGRLDKEATYQISYKLQTGIGRWLDSNSLLHLAIPGTLGSFEGDFSGVQVSERTTRRTANAELDPLRGKAFVQGVSQPHLCKTPDATLWLLARDRSRTGVLYKSHDDGLTFERATFKAEGRTSEVIVFGTGFNMLDQQPAPSGGMYQLAESGGLLYLQRFPQPFAQNRKIGVARTGQTYRLGVVAGRRGNGMIYVTSAGHEFQSDDEFESPPVEREA